MPSFSLLKMVDKSSRTPSNGGRSQSSESTDDSAGKKEPNKGIDKKMDSQRAVKYQGLELLSRSGQGDAWKGKSIEADGSRREVVVKMLHAPFHSPAAAKYTLRELVLLSSLKHPNLISLYDIRLPVKCRPLKNFDELHYVTEYFGRTLHDRIAEKKRQGKVWTHQELSYCVMQTLCGVKFLHESGVVHRDLKPTNIVLNEKGILKILDYGIARDILPENLTPEAGTPFYRAPEIFLGINSYDKKVDIWSIGCILAEMILGRILFTGNNLAKQWQLFVDVLGSPSEFSFLQKLNVKEQNRAVVEAIEPREPVDWEKFIPEEAVPKLVNQFLTIENLRSLLASMLVLDPAKRLDASQVLANPYFDIYRGFLSVNLCAKPEKLYDFRAELRTLQATGDSLDKWKEIALEKVAAIKKTLC